MRKGSIHSDAPHFAMTAVFSLATASAAAAVFWLLACACEAKRLSSSGSCAYSLASLCASALAGLGLRVVLGVRRRVVTDGAPPERDGPSVDLGPFRSPAPPTVGPKGWLAWKATGPERLVSHPYWHHEEPSESELVFEGFWSRWFVVAFLAYARFWLKQPLQRGVWGIGFQRAREPQWVNGGRR